MFLRITKQRRKYKNQCGTRENGDTVYRGVILSSFRAHGVSRHRFIGSLFNIADRELLDMTRGEATRFWFNLERSMKLFGANDSEISKMKRNAIPLLRLTAFGEGEKIRSDRLSNLNTTHYKRRPTFGVRGPYRQYEIPVQVRAVPRQTISKEGSVYDI